MSAFLAPDGVVQWTTGTWRAALTPHGALLLPPEASLDLTFRLWTSLREESVTLPVLLGELIAGLGGHLHTMPDFAVVLALPDHRVHVALRGAPVLCLEGQDMDAQGASTWFETTVPAPAWMSLRAPERPGALTLAAGDAVVPASQLLFGDPTQPPAQDTDPSVAADPAVAGDASVAADPAVAGDASVAADASWEIDLAQRSHQARTHSADLTEPAPAPPAERLGDHDGHTVSELPEDLAADLAAQAEAPGADLDRGQHAGTPTQVIPAASAEHSALVLSAPCANGHPNPTNYTTCMVCGGPLELPARHMVRPALGRVRVSTGEVVELDGTVLVGRSPSGDGVEHLVTVPSPERLVSRNHVRLSLEEWSVLARDLGTNNGTVLHRDGARPVRLSETSPSLMRSGDVLVLGDGIRLTLENLP